MQQEYRGGWNSNNQSDIYCTSDLSVCGQVEFEDKLVCEKDLDVKNRFTMKVD